MGASLPGLLMHMQTGIGPGIGIELTWRERNKREIAGHEHPAHQPAFPPLDIDQHELRLRSLLIDDPPDRVFVHVMANGKVQPLAFPRPLPDRQLRVRVDHADRRSRFRQGARQNNYERRFPGPPFRVCRCDNSQSLFSANFMPMV